MTSPPTPSRKLGNTRDEQEAIYRPGIDRAKNDKGPFKDATIKHTIEWLRGTAELPDLKGLPSAAVARSTLHEIANELECLLAERDAARAGLENQAQDYTRRCEQLAAARQTIEKANWLLGKMDKANTMSTQTARFFCNRCGWHGTGPADANGVEHGGCHYAAYRVDDESIQIKAQKDLIALMCELSKEYYSAGWMDGLEFRLWACIVGDQHRIEEVDVVRLKVLHALTGGWFHWVDGMPRKEEPEPYLPLKFLPDADFQKLYDENKAKYVKASP